MSGYEKWPQPKPGPSPSEEIAMLEAMLRIGLSDPMTRVPPAILAYRLAQVFVKVCRIFHTSTGCRVKA